MQQRLTVIVATALSLAACGSSDPRERQADALEEGADARADAIEAAARERADALDIRAAGLANEAVAIGGYNGEVLKSRADALRRESSIVMRQARAQADAVETQGEASAKQVRAQ